MYSKFLMLLNPVLNLGKKPQRIIAEKKMLVSPLKNAVTKKKRNQLPSIFVISSRKLRHK